MIEIQDEEDKTVSIDLCAGEGKMLAVSIEPSGEITWAIHWDGYRQHGTHQMPKREWVKLTTDEILAVLIAVDPETKRLPKGLANFAYAIEAKLKEKNT